MGQTKPVSDMLILRVFRDKVELVAEMATAGSRMCSEGDAAAGGIDRIVRCGHPEIVEHLGQCPFPCQFLVDAGSKVLDVPPAELVGEGHLVVGGGIDLMVGAPCPAVLLFV